MREISSLILFCLLLSSTSALAAKDSWSINLGLSVRQLSLDVYESGKTDPEGILTEEYSITPELGVESGINYFSDSRFGYIYAASMGRYRMTTQEVDLEDVDLGTSAKGYFLYAMPVGLYDFFKHKKESSLLIGLGVGLGYLSAKGDMILTESEPQVRHSFAFSELTYSYGLFFEYVRRGVGYSISLYGPEVAKGDYEYNLFDFAMTVRKKFSF